MSQVHSVELSDRGIVRVGGPDALKFLQGLLTNDLENLDDGAAQFSGLLSPQGKILFDFFVVRDRSAFLLDVATDRIPALVKRLTMYRLRADVTLDDVSQDMRVFVAWGGTPQSDGGVGAVVVKDPRHDALGYRIYAKPDAFRPTSDRRSDYDAHRIALGIPEGGKDYVYENAYPHEALYDLINGVSFTKGCFVGQEVVSRMEHRRATKKRVVQVKGAAALPEPGSDIHAGDIALGRLGSRAGTHGLAFIRIDRLGDAARQGTAPEADGVPLEFSKPDWATFDLS